MIDKITKLLALRLTSDSQASTIGSIIMYAGGIGIFMLSVLKIADLQLSETQLFFGLLLIVCVTMQMMVGGMLLGIHGRLSGFKRGN